MKELSIEEKAKHYDEAIERIKSWVKGEHPECFTEAQKAAEFIFPELKESKDEGVRKAILELVKQSSHILNPMNQKSMIAWLEKQGDHAKFRDSIQIGDKVTRNKDGVLVNLSQLKRVAKPAEVQDEQKPVEPQQDMLSQEKYAKAVDECIYGEQKPADEVEPKFKVGDWIVFNGLTLYVKEVVKGFYKTISKGGITNSYDWDIDNAARLWTIQDAKDGDVLSYRNGQWIFIYKEIVTEDTFKYYALLSEKGITVNDTAFSLLTSCITPATKEQRNQLEKAMADAGYTFDFEKKELKKIKQKTAWSEEVQEWSEEDKNMLKWVIGYLDNKILNTSIVEEKTACKNAIAWLKSLSDLGTHGSSE